MANRIFNCTTCNDNSPITFVADDQLVPLYNGIPAQGIIGLNSDGSFDESFIYGSGFDSIVRTIEIQNDGKILVGGDYQIYDDVPSNRIIRLNSDGSVDNSFNIGTGFNLSVVSIKIQSDGKILVGGDFTSYNGVSASRVIRLNQDGSVDNSFDYGSGFDNTVFDIEQQSDNTILIGGSFLNYNGTSSPGIVCLNLDGTVNNSFDVGTGFDDLVNTIKINNSGDIIVGGFFSMYDNTISNKIIKLNSDGTVQTTADVGFDSSVYVLELDSDGKIIVGGDFSTYDGQNSPRIIRLLDNLLYDGTFVVGDGCDNNVLTISVQSDNKIIIGGNFSFYNNLYYPTFVKINTDGSIDDDFDIGSGFLGPVNIIKTKNDQSLLVGGLMGYYKPTIIKKLIRLNTNGTYDGSLSYKLGFNNPIETISIQEDGKLIIGGQFEFYNDTTVNFLTRLNSDGSIDTSFDTGNILNGQVYTTVIQPDGKIIVGGEFNGYISRFNSDGSLDVDFDETRPIPDGSVRSVFLQSDGKILIGGDFTTIGFEYWNYLARLESNGSIDSTFGIGTGFDNSVGVIKIQSDGKILIGGGFTSFNGNPQRFIVRLNNDGSLDSSFNLTNQFNSDVQTIDIQTDGKVIVGGRFTQYNGIPAPGIIRLNTDGTIDNTFVNGTGFDGNVFNIKIQDDGKILVGGDFETYDGIGSNYIIRLNSDGSVDTSFMVGNGFDDIVTTIEIQSNGQIVVGGSFNQYPLKSGVFQLVEGSCVSIDTYDVVSRNPVEKFFSFGPFESCTECTTPDDSPGTESIICVNCGDPESVTSTSVPHGIYLDERGRAIAQINTVGMGGFNGLNN